MSPVQLVLLFSIALVVNRSIDMVSPDNWVAKILASTCLLIVYQVWVERNES